MSIATIPRMTTGGPYISVGSGATDRDDYQFAGTYLDKNNPIKVAVFLHSVQVWAHANLTSVKFGVFYLVSGNTYTCRSATTLGAATAGVVTKFSGLNLAAQKGDIIGVSYADTPVGASIDSSNSGGFGLLTSAGDHVIVGDSTAYSLNATGVLSIYATS